MNWQRWRLYPNILCFWFLRAFSFLSAMAICVLVIFLMQLGVDIDKGIPQWRLDFIENKIVKVMHYVFAFGGGVVNYYEYLDGRDDGELFDYSYYLGPNWKKELAERTKKASVVCVNHAHFYDAFMLVGYIPHVTYVAKEQVKKFPFLGRIFILLGSVFVERTSDSSKDATTEAIIKRQELIEGGGTYYPIFIFPEGVTLNSTRLLKFKKGAFAGLKAVLPVISMVEQEPFGDTWEATPLLWALMLSLGCPYTTRKHRILPIFQPNDYLFEMHKDKGDEKWEIFAWAVRHAMARAGEVGTDDTRVRDKLMYEWSMGTPRDGFTPDQYKP